MLEALLMKGNQTLEKEFQVVPSTGVGILLNSQTCRSVAQEEMEESRLRLGQRLQGRTNLRCDLMKTSSRSSYSQHFTSQNSAHVFTLLRDGKIPLERVFVLCHCPQQ